MKKVIGFTKKNMLKFLTSVPEETVFELYDVRNCVGTQLLRYLGYQDQDVSCITNTIEKKIYKNTGYYNWEVIQNTPQWFVKMFNAAYFRATKRELINLIKNPVN